MSRDMAFAACSGEGSLASDGTASVGFLQKAVSPIEQAVQDLEQETRGKLNSITKEQIAICEDVITITGGFADRLIVLGNKLNHLERSPSSSNFNLEISKGFARNLGTLLHNVNQLKEARNETGTKLNLFFTCVANQLEWIKAHMAPELENIQTFNTGSRFRKAEKTKESRLLERNDDEKTFSDEDRDDSTAEHESGPQLWKKKTKKESSEEENKNATWRFQKRSLKRPC